MSDPSGSIVVKPCKQAEIAFYESLSLHPDFAQHAPNFIGTLALSSEASQALAPAALIHPDVLNNQLSGQPQVVNAATIEKAWAPSNGGKITTDSAIVMENVAAGFKKPNILDVKLGARLWADDAPIEKRKRLDEAASQTTSASLGFRICGMRLWQGFDATGQDDVQPDGYTHYGKNYGKQFTSDTVGQGFKEYLRLNSTSRDSKNVRRVIRRFIADLRAMRAVLENEESRMYSASLLFVYEGDDEALQEAFEKEKEKKKETTSMIAQPSSDGNSTTVRENGTTGSDTPTTGSAAETEGSSDEDDEEEPGIQALKLIDFAHAEWTPGKGRDENLLQGITSILRILQDIQSNLLDHR